VMRVYRVRRAHDGTSSAVAVHACAPAVNAAAGTWLRHFASAARFATGTLLSMHRAACAIVKHGRVSVTASVRYGSAPAAVAPMVTVCAGLPGAAALVTCAAPQLTEAARSAAVTAA
jgi:hypothetical protein